MTGARLLTLNCHEAWVWQLSWLGEPFDVVDGLPGRYARRWDEGVRPVPPRARLIPLAEARGPYDCILVHNPSDLLDTSALEGTRLLVLHVTLEHRARQEGRERPPEGFARNVRALLDRLGGRAAAISELKARSWGIADAILEPGIDAAAYPPATGDVASGIRVAHQIAAKRETLLWDFHRAAFADLPVRIVGHNPEIPGAEASRSWDELKSLLASHRFFVHTADPALEDGYNLASLEAMAAGLPVLGNRHPTSPVEHGVSGFLSDDPTELARCARTLLDDRALALRMGAAARARVAERFPRAAFVAALRSLTGRQ